MASTSADVIVVGGGPGGLYAAWRLARDGHSVVVCEEHRTVGDPVHCTGVFATDAFEEFDLDRGSILNDLFTVHFVSPGGLRVSHTTPKAEAVVIDRGQFDRALAARATASGVNLRLACRVTELDVQADHVRVVAGGVTLTARAVVLACGARYVFQQRLGLGLPSDYLHTAQREVPAERLGDVEVHFGRTIAPAGFAWAVPVARDTGPHVRIGVMAFDQVPTWYRDMLARIAPEWGVEASSDTPRIKILPLGPIDRTVSDRVVAIGDAAGVVKPTTGGGIYYSLLTASLAAETIGDGLRRGRLDEGGLAVYEHRWSQHLAQEIDAQRELRRIATAMTDLEIDALFDLATTDGIMPIVRKTAQFNQHRHLIRALLSHPPARRVLFRALAG